ncbi:MAG TPA: M20/M25/M40 family metallo-hydrolase [Bryobacteraceae bacterium]|nr:M20/M25/M40 family metallo-hydrolase [Bryobacteraceae bacterium]
MGDTLGHDDVTTLLQALVSIDSVNSSLVPGGAGEANMARYLMDWCAERGIPAEIDAAAPGRPSVIARVKGKGGGRSVVLNAHMDTVGVAGMPEAFSARVENGRLYGRGSYDMKGSLAACMLALADIRTSGLGGDVILAAVSDEEHASIGVQSVLKRIQADAAIVTEPTAFGLCIAHKGFSWHEITTMGRAAHGSRPDLGIDAIAHMGRVLNGLEALQGELSLRPPHPLLGHGSLHASLISGGQELSSYPETCTVAIERRTLPQETIAAVEKEFEAILQDLAAKDPQFQARQRTSLVRPPFSVPEDAPIVQTLRDQATRVLGHPPATVGAPFWMDAAFFAAAGIPTVNIGPDGAGAHSTEEWVDLDSVEKCREILALTVRVFCA